MNVRYGSGRPLDVQCTRCLETCKHGEERTEITRTLPVSSPFAWVFVAHEIFLCTLSRLFVRDRVSLPLYVHVLRLKRARVGVEFWRSANLHACDLQMEYWVRTPECKEAKARHMDYIDRVAYSREQVCWILFQGLAEVISVYACTLEGVCDVYFILRLRSSG